MAETFVFARWPQIIKDAREKYTDEEFTASALRFLFSDARTKRLQVLSEERIRELPKVGSDKESISNAYDDGLLTYLEFHSLEELLEKDQPWAVRTFMKDLVKQEESEETRQFSGRLKELGFL